MALYFNASNGPVSFVMRDGSAGMIAPKKWQEIAPALETSASILKLVKQGILVRRVEESAPVANTSSKPLVAAPVEAAPVPVPVPSKSVSVAPLVSAPLAPTAEIKPAIAPASVPVKPVVKEAVKEPVKVESDKVAKEVAVSESSSTSSKDSK